MDAISIINPKASNGRHLLVAIDYLTKWVKAAFFTTLTKSQVLRFLKHNIICRYGLHQAIITCNARNLNTDVMGALYGWFKIFHCNSVPYRLKMNGIDGATNKNIKTTLITKKDHNLYKLL